MAAQQLGNARDFVHHPVMFSHLMGERSGPGLEMLVPGRRGSFCFPTARFVIDLEDSVQTVGISWFVVDGPYLFEYSLIVPDDEPLVAEDRISRARAQLLRLTDSLHRTKELPPG